ncbi:hypothetical protein [Bacillus seohaeanensis]|jgi:hypothetical protein|uniref:Preprotein translocase subunit SecA n=1 Tax=Bacillus seohaeanensis TaxID=284580 RepID=A0ABW5RUC1_9BACI
MVTIHFFENKFIVLSQLLNHIPSVDENIKIKGRKGKVVSVEQMGENKFHVHVLLEQATKKKLLAQEDSKKKKR